MQQSVGGNAKHLDLETFGSAANADWGPQGWGPQSLLIKHGWWSSDLVGAEQQVS